MNEYPSNNKSINIIHIITSLGNGGAEKMLINLLQHQHNRSFMHHIICLSQGDFYKEKIIQMRIPLLLINIKNPLLIILSIVRVLLFIQRYKPDIIQAWMYHGNIFAYILIKLFKIKCRQIWNIRHSLDNYYEEKLFTRIVIRLNKLFSKNVDSIIFNSKRSVMHHTMFGFKSNNIINIPNGFNLKVFHCELNKRNAYRTLFDVSNDCCLIGLIGRYHHLKDHHNFLKSIYLLLKQCPSEHWKCLLVGRNINYNNIDLFRTINKYNLADKIILHEESDNISSILNALDVLCLSSSSESFPNVVGEAMATGIPCVVTDVGDAAIIVGDTGIIVPPKDPVSLAKGLAHYVKSFEKNKSNYSQSAYNRINDHFQIDNIINQYDNLYLKLLYTHP